MHSGSTDKGPSSSRYVEQIGDRVVDVLTGPLEAGQQTQDQRAFRNATMSLTCSAVKPILKRAL
jgi:hypothetical protein